MFLCKFQQFSLYAFIRKYRKVKLFNIHIDYGDIFRINKLLEHNKKNKMLLYKIKH